MENFTLKVMKKSDADALTYQTFAKHRRLGATIMEATFKTMSECNILSPATIFQVRKRVEADPVRVRSIMERLDEELKNESNGK